LPLYPDNLPSKAGLFEPGKAWPFRVPFCLHLPYKNSATVKIIEKVFR
jgi:hypothetical protein